MNLQVQSTGPVGETTPDSTNLKLLHVQNLIDPPKKDIIKKQFRVGEGEMGLAVQGTRMPLYCTSLFLVQLIATSIGNYGFLLSV